MMSRRIQIGELAARAGVTHRAIHHYESLGLLSPADRQEDAYRYYDESALERLKLIVSLVQIGLSLEQIGFVIDMYCEDPAAIDDHDNVLETLGEHLVKVETQLASLGAFRSILKARIALVEQTR